MPYTEIRPTMVEGKQRWCFKNRETGERTCSESREKAIAAMRLRYHLESGGKLTRAKK